MIEFLPDPSPLHFTGKATLILINTWGFPIARLIKVKQIAFDNQVVTIRYSLKHERENRIRCTRFSSLYALAKGWQTVDGAFNQEAQGEWTAFDLAAFDGMLRQLSQVVFVSSGDKTRAINFLAQPHSFQVGDRVQLKQAVLCARTVGIVSFGKFYRESRQRSLFTGRMVNSQFAIQSQSNCIPIMHQLFESLSIYDFGISW